MLAEIALLTCLFLLVLWAVPDLLRVSGQRAEAGAWRLNRAAARRGGLKVRVIDAGGGQPDPIGDLFSTLLIEGGNVRLTLLCGNEGEARAAADGVMASRTLQIVREGDVLRALDVHWRGRRVYGLRFLGSTRLLDLTGRIEQ